MRLLFILLIIFLAGCHTQMGHLNNIPPPKEEIMVSAAVSLKDAFNEVARLYESRTGRKVNFNFGASGVLQKQIENAAPVDVFASAGERQMDELAAQGLINQETRRDFARNLLVLIAPANTQLTISSFAELDQPGLQKFAIGNPKTVPVGQYTEQVLTHLQLWPKLQPQLILAEDVRQVLDYVVRGEVEAGIVYASDAVIAEDKVKLLARAPESLHSPILYPIAVIKDSRHHAAAKQFVELVLSAEGQNILRKYGFLNAK